MRRAIFLLLLLLLCGVVAKSLLSNRQSVRGGGSSPSLALSAALASSGEAASERGSAAGGRGGGGGAGMATIYASVVWEGAGPPPVLDSLFARSNRRVTVFVCCPAAPPPSVAAVGLQQRRRRVRYVESIALAGEGHGRSEAERAMLEEQEEDADTTPASERRSECFYLSVPGDAVLVVGWDDFLISMWRQAAASATEKAILTGAAYEADGRPSFLRAVRCGPNGVVTEARPFHTPPSAPSPSLFLSSAFAFGPLARTSPVRSVFAPSLATTDTLHAVALHADGWHFFACNLQVLSRHARGPALDRARADAAGDEQRHRRLSGKEWSRDCGLETTAAGRAYAAFADVGVGGVGARGKLGIVDATDDEESVAKYGSAAAVRRRLSQSKDWPAVKAVV